MWTIRGPGGGEVGGTVVGLVAIVVSIVVVGIGVVTVVVGTVVGTVVGAQNQSYGTNISQLHETQRKHWKNVRSKRVMHTCTHMHTLSRSVPVCWTEMGTAIRNC